MRAGRSGAALLDRQPGELVPDAVDRVLAEHPGPDPALAIVYAAEEVDEVCVGQVTV